ncbi:MAG: L-threonylcarbamoyladenylate synthase [Acidaminococcaceae bacterium]
MQTQLWRLTAHKNLILQLKTAARLLQSGEVIAFPTETVYGLGADGLNATAVSKIFAAKGRPSDNPLILHIAEPEELDRLTRSLSASAKVLMAKFWPGPLTLVVPKSDLVPEVVSAGLDTVAVRMPSHPVARTLIKLARCPIAAPSANKSGRPSPTNAQDVLEDMDGLIAGIVDGGACGIGVESTVVDTTTAIPMILRPGGITLEMLEEVVGAVDIDPALAGSPAFKPKAPGMKYRHYAPQAQMYLVEGTEAEEQLPLIVARALAAGLRVGVLASDALGAQLTPSSHLVLHTWGESVAAVAENLYTCLRAFDHDRVEVILGVGVGETGLGLAVMNRLRKAAGHNVLRAENKKLLLQSGTRPSFL